MVPALGGYAAVVGGEAFTCGLTLGGGVRCWGQRQYGQLGDGDGGNLSTPIATPVDVTGLASGVKQIAASSRTACALTTAGGVKCWGSPAYGAVGASADLAQFASAVEAPLDVTGLTSGVSRISGGAMSYCALMDGGAIHCWGYNQNGQLGNQPQTITVNEFEPVPVQVLGVTNASAISMGWSHACAALATGGVLCWGAGTPSGSDRTGNQIVPAYVRGL